MNREKVALDLNVPVTLALKFRGGKMMQDNGYGPSVLYSTVDDRSLFVDLNTSQAISDLALDPGEPFVLCKVKNGKGPARVNVWRPKEPAAAPAVEPQVVAPAPRPPQGPPPPLPPRLYVDHTGEQLEASLANVAEGKPAAAPRPTPHAPELTAKLNNHPVNGNGAVKLPPVKVPVNRAVVDAVRMVQKAMSETGEQWSDAAR